MRSPAEILLAIGTIIAVARYAVLRDASGLFWTLVTIIVMVGCFFVIPIPYLRVGAPLIILPPSAEARKSREGPTEGGARPIEPAGLSRDCRPARLLARP